MERKDFLKGIGLVSAGTMIPLSKGIANASAADPQACTLIPSETRGPYPLPQATNVSVVTRRDVKETKTGVPLALTVLVQNLQCQPIPSARVDIWHCDKDGYYSGYNNQPGYLGTQNNAGTTFLRGSQTTDAEGKAIFDTIYPGWYQGRVTHIHVEVYVAGVLKRTSQFAFPDALNTTVYTTSPFYTPHGTNNLTNSSDNVFSDGVSSQLLNISGNINSGFAGDHTFTIDYTVLPVTLQSLSGGLEQGKSVLWWSTAEEVNMARYVIESSMDGTNFTAVAQVVARNAAGIQYYSFTSAGSLTANTWYRIKMVENSGRYNYSQIIYIKVRNTQGVSVFPNPAKESITVSHSQADANTYAELLSMEGRSIAYTRLKVGSNSTVIAIHQLAKGAYYLVVVNSQQRQVVKFIKQ